MYTLTMFFAAFALAALFGCPSLLAWQRPGAAAPSYIELTTPLATGPRVVTNRTVPSDQRFGPSDEESRWIVTNSFLPVDRKFFEKIYQMACAPDGGLYVAGGSLVSAAETGRKPVGNGSFYADNGSGIWRIAPIGAITVFGVRPNGYQQGSDHMTARCNVRVAEAAINPDHWGGMAVDGAGNVVVSDAELHLILRFTPTGLVEHVAGGGAQACAYDRWRILQKEGYLDGTAGQALFKQPGGLAFDHEGNLLVADTGNCALRRIDKAGNVTTIRKGCAADDKNPNDEDTRIRYEYVAVGRDGQPVVGGARFARMEQYGNLFRILPDGRAEQLLAGRRFRPQTRQQQLGYLKGIAVLPTGALLITDGNPEVSRVYEVREGRLFTVAGLGGVDMVEGNVDGPALKARMREPGGLCASSDGTVFVRPNSGGRPVRKIDPQTRAVSTWAY